MTHTKKLNQGIILTISLSLLTLFAKAQYMQQLRGTVVDLVLQQPLAGATVTLPAIRQSTITDAEGVFRFRDVPVGTYLITISYSGFKDGSIDNIIVNAGKETVLTIPLEALVKMENEIILRANGKKNKPLNDLSAVSARAFTVEETQRYAAAVNDPLRMATVYAGVMAPDDGNNSIIIRGNSPAGLLWKMEGMDIPNPNHFSSAGTSGGGISILSSQLLSNSDFVTGAFAAEYGNALSGVFDLRLRRGNNEKREYTLQAGFLGLNAALEGPFSKKYKGSYLINYRYSTLELLNKMGVLPDDASTNFQDLSYNFFLPAGNLGTFTLFGFGGMSSERQKIQLDSSKWESRDDRFPYKSAANTGMAGITHTISIGKNATLKSGIGMSYTKNGNDEHYVNDNLQVSRDYFDRFTTRKVLFNSTLNYRFNNQHSLRAGVISNLIKYNFFQQDRETETDPLQVNIDIQGNTSTQQAYAQWQYKPTNDIALNAGLHTLYLALNSKTAVEPRFSVKWNINNKSSLAAGYGQHSQLQALGVYFAQFEDTNGQLVYPNKELDFTKAHHYVLSYSHRLARNLLVKAEAYYQQLYRVPVSMRPGSTYSTLNVEDDYVLDPLSNKGKGKNYGLEISVERYLDNNFYLSLTNSLYQSKYTAGDGVQRNTRFNGNHIATLIAGKEFVNERKKRTFGINIKTIYAGGLRTTPVDFAASQQYGYTVFDENNAFSLQNPAYFRTDLRVSIKWNRKYLTSTLSLDIQNVTNRENIYNQYYSVELDKTVYSYQTGFIPVLNYKVEF
jgi:hypothetical protein